MVKALIVLVLGIVLLGGASVGGWFAYQKYYVDRQDEPKKVEPPPKPPTAFVRLPPLVVPMIGPSRVEQFVTVVVAVEVVLEKQPMVQANQPRLTDAFLTALYGGIADQFDPERGIGQYSCRKGQIGGSRRQNRWQGRSAGRSCPGGYTAQSLNASPPTRIRHPLCSAEARWYRQRSVPPLAISPRCH